MGCGLSLCRKSKQNQLGTKGAPAKPDLVAVGTDTSPLLLNEEHASGRRHAGDAVDAADTAVVAKGTSVAAGDFDDPYEKELKEAELNGSRVSSSRSERGSPLPISTAVVTLKTLESPRSVIFVSSRSATPASVSLKRGESPTKSQLSSSMTRFRSSQSRSPTSSLGHLRMSPMKMLLPREMKEVDVDQVLTAAPVYHKVEIERDSPAADAGTPLAASATHHQELEKIEIPVASKDQFVLLTERNAVQEDTPRGHAKPSSTDSFITEQEKNDQKESTSSPKLLLAVAEGTANKWGKTEEVDREKLHGSIATKCTSETAPGDSEDRPTADSYMGLVKSYITPTEKLVEEEINDKINDEVESQVIQKSVTGAAAGEGDVEGEIPNETFGIQEIESGTTGDDELEKLTDRLRTALNEIIKSRESVLEDPYVSIKSDPIDTGIETKDKDSTSFHPPSKFVPEEVLDKVYDTVLKDLSEATKISYDKSSTEKHPGEYGSKLNPVEDNVAEKVASISANLMEVFHDSGAAIDSAITKLEAKTEELIPEVSERKFDAKLEEKSETSITEPDLTVKSSSKFPDFNIGAKIEEMIPEAKFEASFEEPEVKFESSSKIKDLNIGAEIQELFPEAKFESSIIPDFKVGAKLKDLVPETKFEAEFAIPEFKVEDKIEQLIPEAKLEKTFTEPEVKIESSSKLPNFDVAAKLEEFIPEAHFKTSFKEPEGKIEPSFNFPDFGAKLEELVPEAKFETSFTKPTVTNESSSTFPDMNIGAKLKELIPEAKFELSSNVTEFNLEAKSEDVATDAKLETPEINVGVKLGEFLPEAKLETYFTKPEVQMVIPEFSDFGAKLETKFDDFKDKLRDSIPEAKLEASFAFLEPELKVDEKLQELFPEEKFEIPAVPEFNVLAKLEDIFPEAKFGTSKFSGFNVGAKLEEFIPETEFKSSFTEPKLNVEAKLEEMIPEVIEISPNLTDFVPTANFDATFTQPELPDFGAKLQEIYPETKFVTSFAESELNFDLEDTIPEEKVTPEASAQSPDFRIAAQLEELIQEFKSEASADFKIAAKLKEFIPQAKFETSFAEPEDKILPDLSVKVEEFVPKVKFEASSLIPEFNVEGKLEKLLPEVKFETTPPAPECNLEELIPAANLDDCSAKVFGILEDVNHQMEKIQNSSVPEAKVENMLQHFEDSFNTITSVPESIEAELEELIPLATVDGCVKKVGEIVVSSVPEESIDKVLEKITENSENIVRVPEWSAEFTPDEQHITETASSIPEALKEAISERIDKLVVEVVKETKGVPPELGMKDFTLESDIPEDQSAEQLIGKCVANASEIAQRNTEQLEFRAPILNVFTEEISKADAVVNELKLTAAVPVAEAVNKLLDDISDDNSVVIPEDFKQVVTEMVQNHPAIENCSIKLSEISTPEELLETLSSEITSVIDNPIQLNPDTMTELVEKVTELESIPKFAMDATLTKLEVTIGDAQQSMGAIVDDISQQVVETVENASIPESIPVEEMGHAISAIENIVSNPDLGLEAAIDAGKAVGSIGKTIAELNPEEIQIQMIEQIVTSEMLNDIVENSSAMAELIPLEGKEQVFPSIENVTSIPDCIETGTSIVESVVESTLNVIAESTCGSHIFGKLNTEEIIVATYSNVSEPVPQVELLQETGEIPDDVILSEPEAINLDSALEELIPEATKEIVDQIMEMSPKIVHVVESINIKSSDNEPSSPETLEGAATGEVTKGDESEVQQDPLMKSVVEGLNMVVAESVAEGSIPVPQAQTESKGKKKKKKKKNKKSKESSPDHVTEVEMKEEMDQDQPEEKIEPFSTNEIVIPDEGSVLEVIAVDQKENEKSAESNVALEVNTAILEEVSTQEVFSTTEQKKDEKYAGLSIALELNDDLDGAMPGSSSVESNPPITRSVLPEEFPLLLTPESPSDGIFSLGSSNAGDKDFDEIFNTVDQETTNQDEDDEIWRKLQKDFNSEEIPSVQEASKYPEDSKCSAERIAEEIVEALEGDAEFMRPSLHPEEVDLIKSQLIQEVEANGCQVQVVVDGCSDNEEVGSDCHDESWTDCSVSTRGGTPSPDDGSYHQAATKIQAGFRGFRTRQLLKRRKYLSQHQEPSGHRADESPGSDNSSLISREDAAATKIQAGFRGYQVRREMNRLSTNGPRTRWSRLQTAHRNSVSENAGGTTPPSACNQDQAATKIQAQVRGFLVRRRQARSRQFSNSDAIPPSGGCPTWLSKHRGLQTRRESLPEMRRARQLIRDSLDRRGSAPHVAAGSVEGAELPRRQHDQAAVKIQAAFRGFRVRQRMKQAKSNRRDTNSEPEEVDRKQAATVIQAGFRGYKARKQMKPRNSKAHK